MTNATNKTALVVGGGGGIGLGIARALADEGFTVAIADLREDSLRNAAESREPALRWKACDITDRAQVAEMVRWMKAETGSIDILVNSAGINIGNRMMSTIDPEEYDKVMAVNHTGTFNCIHAALPTMREQHSGLIVNIVSLAGMRVMKLAGVPYCTSKFATAALGMFVNLEEAEHGIRVTNIYPGETNTPIVDKRPAPPPPEQRARMLQPEDIAACVVLAAKLPPRAVLPEIVITPTHMLYG